MKNIDSTKLQDSDLRQLVGGGIYENPLSDGPLRR